MNIVQINAVYHSGSTGRLTEELHNHFLSNGLKSHVFCTNNNCLEKGIYKMGNKFDYLVHSMLSRLFGKQAYFSSLSTYLLLRKLDKISPSAIILGNLHGNYINFPMLLKYIGKKQIPTILVLHDCWFFTGHCCYYTEDNCEKWRDMCQKCSVLHKYNKSLFFDNSNYIFNHKKRLFSSLSKLYVVGVSDWIKNEAQNAPVLSKATNFLRIYNWINLDLFKPMPSTVVRKELHLEDSSFILLGVSQYWSDYKGLNRFIRLAKEKPSYKIILIGQMPSNISLPSNIVSVGVLKSAQILAKYYNVADVFINFSIQETFGLVSAEAIACGTPLITNTYTANPEICGNNCGYIVDLDDWTQVLDAIEKVKVRTKFSFSESCRNFAVTNFNKAVSLNSYLNLVKSISKHD